MNRLALFPLRRIPIFLRYRARRRHFPRDPAVPLVQLILLLFLACRTGPAAAEEKTVELPPTVVEAEAPHEAGAATPVVSVIDPSLQIPAGQLQDVTDLLRNTASIFIQDSSYGKNVFLRNLGDQDYRILIDGIPFGQMGRYYTRSLSWETIPLGNIDRIEVIRGVGSAEYGNTLVGTINLVTRRGKGALKGSARWSMGTFTDVKGGATCSGSAAGWDWFWGGSYHRRNPYLDNNDVDQWSIFSSVGYDLQQWGDLHLSGYATGRKEGFVLDDRVDWNVWSDAQDLAPGSDFDLDTQGIQASWASGWVDAAFSFTGQGRDDDYRREDWENGDWQDFNLWYKAPAVKVKVHHHWRNHEWKLGGEYTYGDADAKWVYYGQGIEHVSFNQDLYAFFAEDSWRILPEVTLTVGIRFDGYENRISSKGAAGGKESKDKISDTQWSPRVSVTWDVTDGLQAYGFFGRVFKAPAMADLYRWYGNYNLISQAGRAVLRAFYDIHDQPPGAPAELIPPEIVEDWQATLGSLSPAKGYDGEVGLRHGGDRFFYSLNLFYEYIDDYIVIYPVSYPPTYNVDKVQLWGLECSGVYTFSKWLELEAAYAFIQNDKEGDEIVEKLYGRKELFNAPEHTLNIFVRSRPLEGFTAEWQVHFVSGRFAGGAPGVPPQMADRQPKFEPITELDAYDIHSIRLSYEPGTWKGLHPRFSFAVENLFDRRDFIRLDYPLPGRLFYGGIEMTF